MATKQVRPEYVSFDNYGTLINWVMDPVTLRLLDNQLNEEDTKLFLKRFSKYRYDQILGDWIPFEEVLNTAYARTCKRFGIKADPSAGKELSDAVISFDAHEDIIAPLTKMGEHYKIIILSNADNRHLAAAVPKLRAKIHKVFTAEQAQAYKPRFQAFEYMLDQLDAKPEDFLHVASHTLYDMVPAEHLGFPNTVLLDRGFDPLVPIYGYTRVESLEEVNSMLGLDDK